MQNVKDLNECPEICNVLNKVKTYNYEEFYETLTEQHY